ncbi:VOC family protein [Chitinophaga sp. MM2321]|uniref:VOC family protein n=1 Tax=Chitinophaga sp. MM2321 TaxID=3137178 RepID=UPI0032D5AB1D
MAQLNPYLNFDNNCREAMNFYQACLGGQLDLQTVGEMPAMAKQMPPEMKDHILHSYLKSGDIVIMASDLSREKRIEGNTVHLCINCEDEDQINSFFTKLSAGGKITEPLTDMPWGAKYGALTDKYGKHWVFNYRKEEGKV